MTRTRTLVVSAVGAVAVVAALGFAGSSGPGSDQPPSSSAGWDDGSIYAAALGSAADGSADDNARPGFGRPGRGPVVGMIRWVLHGEAVVKDRSGDFVTVATQAGEVTAVEATSVTVKSEDGYSRTWVLNDTTKYWGFPGSATKADLEVGVEVRLAGSVDGSTATARLVVFPPKAGSLPQRSGMPHPSWMPHRSWMPHPGGSGPPGGSGQPAPSASVHTTAA